MEKITNVKAMAKAIEICENNGVSEEVLTKLANIKASYERKSSVERKPTATQLLNEDIKVEILGILADTNEPMTATDVVKSLTDEYSNQKISHLLNDLVKDGKANKSKNKGKTYFATV